ncbi:hypothetical protein HMPREF1545_03996 [Oscillibacter sp. KLE 1728]|nr:hypothetical protein HMPREF1545_03996 [Oscillibacter sp. KLE 1728]ERK59241.1 hypothetical protein HMPREF1546_03416 [Oscillibacter sp. KLE 1745]
MTSLQTTGGQRFYPLSSCCFCAEKRRFRWRDLFGITRLNKMISGIFKV